MKKSYVYAAIAIFFWSTLSTISKLLLGSFSGTQVLCVSALFSFVALLVWNIATGEIKKLKAFRLRDYAVVALIGSPGMLFYYIFYFAGAARMPASQAFIVNYLWPIMSVVFACLLLRERMTVRKGIAIGLSFLGVATVVGGELLHFDGNVLIGSAMCALGAVCYGLFTALNQKIYFDKNISMMINSLVAFLVTFVLCAARGELFIPTLVEGAGFAWSGIFTMAVANTLWAKALEGGNTAKISNLAYITPFASLIWTRLVLGEPLQFNFVIGLAIIVLGIMIQLGDKKKSL